LSTLVIPENISTKYKEKVFRFVDNTVAGKAGLGIVFKTKGTAVAGLEMLFLKLDIFAKGI
jgi:hypothetical protein